MNIGNAIKSILLNDEQFINNIKYNNDGYYIHKKNKNKNIKVTIVLPTFNAEDTIEKNLLSIINQSIGFEHIELLIIDDKSDDNTRFIIMDYAKKYKNIFPVFLKHNSGTPAKPRNLGINLAKGEYILFIDADDWLHRNGIHVLYQLLKKTGDDYAIGKTIKVKDKKTFVTGEYNNWKNRESIDPYSIDHIFRHLAPTARMMRLKLLKENNIRFPEMKYAEDKQFFIDVLTNCKTISTSKEIIYYINRNKNNSSLTKTTTIFDKMDANISVIKYVIQKNFPTYIEKMILTRLFEFDFITRFLNKKDFLVSENKKKYFNKFSEGLSALNILDYDIINYFFEPWHKTLVTLFREERFKDVINLIDWHQNERIKEYYIEKDLPYYRLPIEDYHRARINMLATHFKSIKTESKLILQFHIYGDHLNDINSLLIRQRNNDLNDIEFDVQRKDVNLFECCIGFNQLESLSNSSHAIYITHKDYRKVPIRMNVRNIVNHGKRKLDFYTTVSDNFGLNIK